MTVCKPLCMMNLSKNKIFKGPNIFPKNVKINTLNNIMIFDLEPDCATMLNTEVKHEFLVPNIREWSYIHIKKQLPTNLANMNSDFAQETFKTTYSYEETIQKFCTLYEELDYPYIIAHNGTKFDFLILIANVYRYLPNAKTIVSKFKYFDSYIWIKDLKINKNQQSNSNIELFLRYNTYMHYNKLQYEQHKSLQDCQMLLVWINEVMLKQV